MAELSYSQCYLYSFDFDLSLDSYPLRISDTAVSCDELPYVEYEDISAKIKLSQLREK